MPYTDYNQVLHDLADNIRESNGSTASIRFVDMPDLIGSYLSPRISLQWDSISFLKYKLIPYVDTSGMTNMHTMLRSFFNLQTTSVDFSHFDTSNVTDMSEMFSSFYVFSTNLDLSSFDTSKVTNMSSMFTFCQTAYLNVSSFDTSNVTDMSFMFRSFNYYNSNGYLDLSHFNTSKVTNMSGMFYQYGVKSDSTNIFSVTLNVTGWDVSNVTAFNNCFALTNNSMDPSYSLTELDLSGWNTSSAKYMGDMFKNSRLRKIWIPSTFVATNCTSYEKPFSSAPQVTCHIYTDATDVTTQGWGTIHSSFVVHYNSTHADYENA